MACGAGLPLLAIAVTAAHFIVIFGFMSLERHLPKSRWSPTSLQVSYEDGRGILRYILTACTQQDFAVTGVQVERDGEAGRDRRGKQSGRSRAREAAYATATVIDPSVEAPLASKGTVTVALELRGGCSIARLVDKLSEIGGVSAVKVGDAGLISESQLIFNRSARCSDRSTIIRTAKGVKNGSIAAMGTESARHQARRAGLRRVDDRRCCDRSG